MLRAELARLNALKLHTQLPVASWGRQDDLPAMLLHWAAFIGSRWGLSCESLSEGVADGGLLCLMVGLQGLGFRGLGLHGREHGADGGLHGDQ